MNSLKISGRAVPGARAAAAVVVAAMALAGFVPTARAALLTFNFEGSLCSGTDCSVIPNGQIGFTSPALSFAGATISGSYTFDTLTADSDASAAVGRYNNTLSALSGSVSAGANSFTFVATDGDILVENNSTNARDVYEVSATRTADSLTDTLADYTINNFLLSLRLPNAGDTPPSLSSDALPLIPPSFDSPHVVLTFLDSNNVGGNKIEFQVRLSTDTDVPEPASLLLFGGALAGLGCYRRRRKVA